ncbi:hypothetical protein [Aeromonas salmonicida]|uniref:hypothetical protein n=1 Tax=Aeromonas salmonicida TaxID=645 RepID=UPI00240D310A|nr:hypothetical protein [Aeromonas salmonicida]MDM5149248.1 hypothetical protein [Aeromonas salmonicida]WFC12864.1 hypothetical protein L3V47_14075 [Aeromonas salmonicida]
MNRTYPPEWDRFCELNKQHPNFSLFKMDANTVIADVNRFAARYRMIKDLERVKISGAQDVTEDGYTALLRILFVWGATETLFELTGVDINQQRNEFVTAYDPAKVSTLDKKLKSLRPEVDNFFTVIKDKSKPAHVMEINKFLSNQPYDPSFLLSGIRHIFSHGTLSPNTGTKDPKITIKISNLLADFFTELVEEQFKKIVKNHNYY